MNSTILSVINAGTAFSESGKVYLSRKTVQGMKQFALLWPSRVRLIIKDEKAKPSGIDIEEYSTQELNFEIVICDFNTLDFENAYLDSIAVLATLELEEQKFVAQNCRKKGVICIDVKETSLQTKYQMIDARTSSFVIRLRRYFWIWSRNKFYISKQLPYVDALQCNGVPTFKEFKEFKENRLLYFDTRSSQSIFISQQQLESKKLYLTNKSNPLRLGFSGRLTEIKGVLDILEVCRKLKEIGMHFTCSIFGDGNLKQELINRIKEYQLHEYVYLKGNLDFETELIPALHESIDLFVMPHLQGDPSCTYLETLSCGIPIVGYNNEAWKGMLPLCNAGVGIDLRDYESLAFEIVELDKNREKINNYALNAVSFARDNDFETVMEKRVQHILSMVNNKYTSVFK